MINQKRVSIVLGRGRRKNLILRLVPVVVEAGEKIIRWIVRHVVGAVIFNVRDVMERGMPNVLNVAAREKSPVENVMERVKLHVMTAMVPATMFACSAMVRVISCRT